MTNREELELLRACVGTIRGIVREDLPAENISGEHAERYTREVCSNFTSVKALKKEYDRVFKEGFLEGESKQAILELRARDRFIDSLPAWIAIIKAERMRQDSKWGEQNHDDGKWLKIIVEELGEVAKALLEGDSEQGVKELSHVCAVGVAWMEAIGRRT